MYNEKVKSLLVLFLFLSLFLSMLCYLSIDPMKSCLYLVFSLVLLTPFLSLMNEAWYSYFICMIFLSGIFVILVYFTSMSKYIFHKLSLGLFIMSGLFFVPSLFLGFNMTLSSLYYKDLFFIFLFLLLSLVYFMNFSSYFLNYSGALRKAYYFIYFLV